MVTVSVTTFCHVSGHMYRQDMVFAVISVPVGLVAYHYVYYGSCHFPEYAGRCVD